MMLIQKVTMIVVDNQNQRNYWEPWEQFPNRYGAKGDQSADRGYWIHAHRGFKQVGDSSEEKTKTLNDEGL